MSDQSVMTVEAGIWIRKKGRNRNVAVFGACFAVFMLAMPLVTISSARPHHPYSAGSAVGIFAFFVAIAVAATWFSLRLARAGLRMTPDGVTVRNPLRTYDIALSDVESFAPGVLAGGGPNGTPCPVIKRKHGRDVGVWALGREGVVWRMRRYGQEMAPLCAELNGLLGQLKPKAATPAQ